LTQLLSNGPELCAAAALANISYSFELVVGIAEPDMVDKTWRIGTANSLMGMTRDSTHMIGHAGKYGLTYVTVPTAPDYASNLVLASKATRRA
jgi:hypothetical protein